MNDWKDASFSLTRCTLGGAALMSAICTVSSDELASNGLNAIVNFIAYLHYVKISNLFETNKQTMPVRMMDWLITLPIMAIEINLLSGTTLVRSLLPALFSMLTIFLGILAEISRGIWKTIYVITSIICMSVVFILSTREFVLSSTPNNTLDTFFAFLFMYCWILYPFVFVLEERDVLFNLLDFFSKSILAITVSIRTITDVNM